MRLFVAIAVGDQVRAAAAQMGAMGPMGAGGGAAPPTLAPNGASILQPIELIDESLPTAGGGANAGRMA